MKMRMRTRSWITIALLTFVCATFMACGDDDEENDNGVVLPPDASDDKPDTSDDTPSSSDEKDFVAEPYFVFPQFAKKGGVFYGFVGLDETQSSEGAKIDSVIYELDGVRVAKVTKEIIFNNKKIFPLSMNFAGSAFGFGTKHSLSVNLYCSGEEYEQTIEGESFLVKPGTVLGSKLPIIVMPENSIILMAQVLVGSKGTIKKGETLSAFIWGLNGTKDLKVVVKAELYWDGIFVKAKTFLNENDFTGYLDYIVDSPGEHKMKIVISKEIEGSTTQLKPTEYDFAIKVVD